MYVRRSCHKIRIFRVRRITAEILSVLAKKCLPEEFFTRSLLGAFRALRAIIWSLAAANLKLPLNLGVLYKLHF